MRKILFDNNDGAPVYDMAAVPAPMKWDFSTGRWHTFGLGEEMERRGSGPIRLNPSHPMSRSDARFIVGRASAALPEELGMIVRWREVAGKEVGLIEIAMGATDSQQMDGTDLPWWMTHAERPPGKDGYRLTVVGHEETREVRKVGTEMAVGETKLSLAVRTSSGKTWIVSAPPEMIVDLVARA